MKNDFKATQDEAALIRQMQSVYSTEEVVKAAEGAGVMVPSVRDKDGTGYDIFSLLLKSRVIVVNSQVESTMAAVIVAQLRFLNDADPSKPIDMLINSPGGSVIDGCAIYDTMRSISAPVRTVGLGMQASMGSILMAGGDERLMARNAKLMIHSIGSGTQGKLSEQEISLEVTRRLFEDMKAVYIRHIGLNEKFWDLICAKDTWLSADQALKMGFIDKIYTGSNKPARFDAAADAFLKAAQDKREADVAGKSTQELKEMFLGTADADSMGERRRAEAIVELSQRPEFWTDELKAVKAKQAAASKVSNDDRPNVAQPRRYTDKG
ncbi:MAG: ATP-dependent Clp protease proteolytic subunit [Alphaproteobacteria bacterium]|nr:ATP-dependent Clp protease proteolytic subunit [Alphaproteobacteria bacterium]MDE2336812.1 ATP-dependent Clp protease proteolytic subunit [Alphaproteobacteria bacterium]